MAGDLACVVSNHESLREEAEKYGLPFHYIPVTKEMKPEAEAEQIQVAKEYGCELVVMARYTVSC